MIKIILKRMEESDTYLTHVCRHRWSRKNPEKLLICHQFSPGSFCSSDVDRHESGRCRSVPFFLKPIQYWKNSTVRNLLIVSSSIE